ncbi:ethanolamine kinase-like protein [Cryptosporidium hominis]
MTWNTNLLESKLKEAERVSWKLFKTGICKCCDPNKLIKSKILTGGLSNILVLISISIDSFCEDMKRINKNILIPNLKVRFYSEERKIFVNEKREQLIQNLLANAGIIKPILQYFQGGQIEEFVEGRTLEVEDLRNRKTYIQVAKKIASLHSTKISQDILENICLEYNSEIHQGLRDVPYSESNNKSISILWPTLDKWASLSEESFKLNHGKYQTCINFEKLRILICKLKKSLYSDTLSKLTCSIVVSHSDLLPGNIIETLNNNYTFIDYEFSGTMECVFDIGNHLCEWAGFTCNWEYLPNDETISEFLKYYIAGLSSNKFKENRFESKKDEAVSNTNLGIKKDELENNYQCINHEKKEAFEFENSDSSLTIKSYVKAVKTCMVISNIFWGLWGICKSDIRSNNSSNSVFDYRSYAYRKLESINTQPYFRDILKGIDQDIEFPVF